MNRLVKMTMALVAAAVCSANASAALSVSVTPVSGTAFPVFNSMASNLPVTDLIAGDENLRVDWDIAVGASSLTINAMSFTYNHDRVVPLNPISFTVVVTENNLTFPVNSNAFSSTGSVVGAVGSTLNSFMASATPSAPGAVLNFGPINATPVPAPFGGITIGQTFGPNPGTISLTFRVTLNGYTNLTIGSQVNTVGNLFTPVPATALAAFLALPALGLVGRLRRKVA